MYQREHHLSAAVVREVAPPGAEGVHQQQVLNGAKDSYGFGVFAAFIVPMGDGGEVAWSAAAPCR
jgi:hypothetical protein